MTTYFSSVQLGYGLSNFKNGFPLKRPLEQVAFCSNIKRGQWCLASGKCLIIQLLNFLWNTTGKTKRLLCINNKWPFATVFLPTVRM